MHVCFQIPGFSCGIISLKRPCFVFVFLNTSDSGGKSLNPFSVRVALLAWRGPDAAPALQRLTIRRREL